MKMLLQNGLVADGECKAFHHWDILICDGVIEKIIPRGAVVAGDAAVIDATGKYILPGMIDIHNHGGFGVDFGVERDSYVAGKDYGPALDLFAKQGVPTVLATLCGAPQGKLLSLIKHALNEQKKECGARIGGLHLEGPFISEKKRGAIRHETVPCSVETFETLWEAAEGQLRAMTIAPERENALDVIRKGASLGVRMSIGHTNATYEEACAGIAAGATGSTHTFNGMRSLMHRDPGVLGAVLTDPNVICEAICDMVHLSPATVKLILAAKGMDKVILISDAGYITGLEDGVYDLPDGRRKFVKEGKVCLEDGTIAGSCFTMADGARNLIKLGCSLLDIAKLGARNPARAVGLTDRGEIREGLLADLIITNEDMTEVSVVLRGEQYC